jgi:hypothetical protein
MLLGVALSSLAAPVSAVNPPGNNGTVKVDAKPVDDLPDNESHPSCVFEVDFYGFDQGTLYAWATFTLISPTVAVDYDFKTSEKVYIGEDPAYGAGVTGTPGTSDGLDASQEFDLNNDLFSYMGADGKGAHVKLTVHAQGAANADTKYKTFWVTGCEYQNSDT